MPSGPTPAVRALVNAGVQFELHSYRHDPDCDSYGDEVVAALDVDPLRVLKTLIVEADTRLACAVVPVAHKLDFRSLAGALDVKSTRMAERAAAERSSGYVIGGVSPIGQKRKLATIVDETALAWPTVYVSAGRRGLELEISPADLLRATNATTARISRS